MSSQSYLRLSAVIAPTTHPGRSEGAWAPHHVAHPDVLLRPTVWEVPAG